MKEHTNIPERLEYLRRELRAERISYGELAELQDLAEHIDPGDVELLYAAGVPEEGAEETPPDIACEERWHEALRDAFPEQATGRFANSLTP